MGTSDVLSIRMTLEEETPPTHGMRRLNYNFIYLVGVTAARVDLPTIPEM